MLAPRKTLWSTPPSAIETALSFAQLDADDVVYDVGCGDGRVLIQMASKSIPVDKSASTKDDVTSTTDQQHHCHQFIGLEISHSRALEAQTNIDEARRQNLIRSHVTIEIRVANALEVDYSNATVLFLYLVPRGLRLIRPVLWKAVNNVDDMNGADETDVATYQESDHAIQPGPIQKKPKRIITYMNPIENEPIVKKEYCKVGNVEGAAFPIYLYHIL